MKRLKTLWFVTEYRSYLASIFSSSLVDQLSMARNVSYSCVPWLMKTCTYNNYFELYIDKQEPKFQTEAVMCFLLSVWRWRQTPPAPSFRASDLTKSELGYGTIFGNLVSKQVRIRQEYYWIALMGFILEFLLNPDFIFKFCSERTPRCQHNVRKY